jgi:hypothetical protein
MPRFTITPRSPFRLRYRDSLHAAFIAGLRAAGVPEERLLGPGAAPWTFGVSGRSFPHGPSLLRVVTLSTPDPSLGEAISRLAPTAIRWSSANGDEVDLSGAVIRHDPLPLLPGQDELAVAFASPFLVSERSAAKKTYARSVVGLDLSSAFSTGLSRRLGRPIQLNVTVDRLSALTDGAQPVLVRVRRTGTRDLILPALSATLTLRAPEHDLRDAFLAGLGEKTRYGFGCPIALS